MDRREKTFFFLEDPYTCPKCGDNVVSDGTYVYCGSAERVDKYKDSCRWGLDEEIFLKEFRKNNPRGVIYKYPLSQIPEEFVLDLPKGTRFLHVERQDNSNVLWAIVNPYEEVVLPKRFLCVWTGRELPHREMTYLGTCVGNPLVSHYFLLGKNDDLP